MNPIGSGRICKKPPIKQIQASFKQTRRLGELLEKIYLVSFPSSDPKDLYLDGLNFPNFFWDLVIHPATRRQLGPTQNRQVSWDPLSTFMSPIGSMYGILTYGKTIANRKPRKNQQLNASLNIPYIDPMCICHFQDTRTSSARHSRYFVHKCHFACSKKWCHLCVVSG